MKTIVKRKQTIEISAIRIHVPVRYEEEDIPNDFPMRNGDIWQAEVEIDTGKIKDWPQGKAGSLYMKVVDEGDYTLLGPHGNVVAMLEGDYVPHGVVPGEWGDYINLEINEDGIVTNWPAKPDVSKFFDQDEA